MPTLSDLKERIEYLIEAAMYVTKPRGLVRTDLVSAWEFGVVAVWKYLHSERINISERINTLCYPPDIQRLLIQMQKAILIYGHGDWSQFRNIQKLGRELCAIAAPGRLSFYDDIFNPENDAGAVR